MTDTHYERNLPYDLYDDGDLHNIDVEYSHHYQRPEFNSWDSDDNYRGYNYCEVHTVMLNEVLVDGEYGELEQLLLEEFIDREGDYL